MGCIARLRSWQCVPLQRFLSVPFTVPLRHFLHQIKKKLDDDEDGDACWLSIAVCIQWFSFVNQNSINGARLGAQYNTPAACQQYCVITPQCVAVDFNLNDNTCWVHVNADNLLSQNTYNLINVTQYRISRDCANTTTPTTTTTTTTGAFHTSAGCGKNSHWRFSPISRKRLELFIDCRTLSGCPYINPRYKKVKNKKVKQSTCIAPCMVQTTLKRSGMDHTV